MSTFVSVGNAKQSFERLLLTVQTAAACLPLPVIVQCGHNHFVDTRCEVIDFMSMEDFQHAISAADLVILHGGAGSIITALTTGKTPVVMARKPERGEHVDHHQVEFVEEMAKAGKIVAFDDQQSLQSAVEFVLAKANQLPAEQRPVPELIEMIKGDLKRIAVAQEIKC